MRICSFPQLFPPTQILGNCYSDLKPQLAMDSHKEKQNDLVLYRKRMGFTQKQVARLLGQRDATMISHYEHGRALPPLAMALSLEIIYRTPVAFLFPTLYDELRRQIRKQEESFAGAGQRPLF